jgi:hypothetical protein
MIFARAHFINVCLRLSSRIPMMLAFRQERIPGTDETDALNSLIAGWQMMRP